MRIALLLVFCVLLAGCLKTDLPPFPAVTRVEVRDQSSDKNLSDPAAAVAVVDFVNRQRLGWTRTFVFGFGAPSPFLHINLYDDSGLIAQLSLRSGVLPGGHALFEVRTRKARAYKRIAKSEANRFLDLVGVGGELK